MKTLLLGLRPDSIRDDQFEQVQRMASGYRVVQTEDRDEVEGLLPDIEIIAGTFPQELLPKAPKLRWWQQWIGGADWLMDHPEAASLDFVLTNVSGLHGIPITEHVFGMLLGFTRDLPNVIRAQQRTEWIRHDEQDVFELADQTMVLIGVGGVGSHTATVAKAFGMNVIAVRRRPDQPAPGIERTVGIDRLQDVLPEADFVVSTLPMTSETQNVFGEAEFRAMKRTACFVNVGRGKSVDEEAMVRALQEGWIAGAGLDVFAVEPLPSESPLWEMENVIVSPHYAGQRNRYGEKAFPIFAENLKRYLAGEPLVNVVDKRLGY